VNVRDQRGQRKAAKMRASESRQRGLRTVPSVIQVSGGYKFAATPFRIVAYHADGTPRLFEILPAGEQPNGIGRCVLYAFQDFVRAPAPAEWLAEAEKIAQREEAGGQLL
jgi:hypothetical protein